MAAGQGINFFQFSAQPLRLRAIRRKMYLRPNSFNMGFDVTGKLVAKFDTVQRTETFRTREFVIESSEDINGRIITNYIKFQSVQDRTQLIDRFNIGDELKVHFNIKGSRWEKNGQVNYITNLDAWRLESASMQGGVKPAPQPSFTESTAGEPASDDLPF
jgi:hypothetical protein